MTKSRGKIPSVALLTVASLILAIGCASGAPAQPKRTLIRVEVKPPETSTIKSLVEEGESLRIEDHSADKVYAFRPIISSEPAKVRVFRLQKEASGKEVEVLLEEADLPSIGQDSPRVRVLGSYTFRILQIIKP